MNTSSKKNIRTLTLEELQDYFATLGEKKFRVKQVWEWLWQKHAHSFDDMTNLSKELRQTLSDTFSLPAIALDIAQGLQFLHQHHIIHCDMHSGNVLIDHVSNHILHSYCFRID